MNTVVQRTAAAPHPATPKRSGSGAPRSAPRAPGIDRILLDRDRLLAQDEGRPVLVIEGPSGYGKTVLAEMWLERQRTQLTCCWVSIDAASCDPVLFLEQLLRAVGAENPGRPEGGIDDEAARAERFALLCSRLDEEPRGFCIVIDDAHVLADSPSLTYLANLLDIASAKLRIGLTMQPGKIAVGLGPMTARGQASWIQAKHLALTREECEAFARLRGQNLSASQADWLFRATEGWPVLTLLALAAPLDPSPDDVAAVTGSGPLRSYIYERFVRGLSPDDQAVLFALSCLGSAPLALLTALEPAPARVELALIHFRSLGIVQNRDLDEGSVISLHALVREAAGRLVDPGPDRSRDALIREAAEWYWRNGSGAAAVRLALDAGPSLANLSRAWLIKLGFGFIFRSGQHQTYLDLVERYESVSGAPDPEIDQTAAWALIFQRQFALAESRMTRIERSGVERLIDTVPLQRSVMLSLRDNYVQGGELSLRWIRTHAGQHTFDMGVASMVSAFSAKCLGCFDDAHVALREGMYCFNVAQSAYGIGWSHVVGAIVLAQAGRYRAALAQVEGGLTRCPASQGFGSLRTLLRGIEAFLRYERNETERVRELLGEVLPFMADQGVVDAMILGFAAAARARASAGDYGTALDILSEGELIGLQREFPRLTYGLQAERALLLLRNGAANQAPDRRRPRRRQRRAHQCQPAAGPARPGRRRRESGSCLPGTDSSPGTHARTAEPSLRDPAANGAHRGTLRFGCGRLRRVVGGARDRKRGRLRPHVPGRGPDRSRADRTLDPSRSDREPAGRIAGPGAFEMRGHDRGSRSGESGGLREPQLQQARAPDSLAAQRGPLERATRQALLHLRGNGEVVSPQPLREARRR